MSVAKSFHDFSTRPGSLDFYTVPQRKEDLIQILKTLTDSLKNAQNRDSLPNYVFRDMLSILSRISHTLFERLKDGAKQLETMIHMVDLATECFRALRNSCAGCKHNQEAVLKNPGLYWTVANILSTLVNTPKTAPLSKNQEGKNSMIQCLRCGVQFLGNAAAGFDESKSLVWGSVFPMIKMLLRFEDGTLANYTCMLIYTCLTASNMTDLISTPEGVEIISAVMLHYAKHETEWGLYIMEKLLAQSNFVQTSLNKFGEKDQEMLLNFICKKLRSLEDKNDGHSNHAQRDSQLEIRVAMGNIEFVSSDFKTKSSALINLSKLNDIENKGPTLAAKLLEVLCSASSSHHYKELQNDVELLKQTISVLQAITEIGKKGDNVFSSITKLSDSSKVKTDHPAFGLKRDLIRVIGNLSYRHPVNQNTVREAGAIPCILDSTNIDARNPFIREWSIFAIRNLSENNPENQSYISSLKLEGLSGKTGFLNDIGMEASIQGEKVTLKPIKKDEKPTAKTKR